MIEFEGISKQFGNLRALDNVNIAFDAGKSYALIGPNGSGKTTMIKSILGMVIPTHGVIRVDSESIANDWKYREKIGYMPQIGHYPQNMRIGQVFDMMKNIRRQSLETDEELIDAFNLNTIYDKRMHAMSGGTRQKVSAALAFLFHAPILVLDEPTAGLDPVSVEILKDKIIREKSAGKLMIISSHILSDLDELCTDVVYIFEGKIEYHDSLEDLKVQTGENRLGKAIANMITQKELKVRQGK
ncbi:MAG: ABC transporter ATP-binding protein [Cyclobacteriaceae bacterium]